jgi:hypothetical protein
LCRVPRWMKSMGWVGSNPQPTPIARRLSGLLESSWKRRWFKTLKHRDCQLWILLGFQLSLNNPGLLNRFEFQNNNGFQLLAQSLGCVRAVNRSPLPNSRLFLAEPLTNWFDNCSLLFLLVWITEHCSSVRSANIKEGRRSYSNVYIENTS